MKSILKIVSLVMSAAVMGTAAVPAQAAENQSYGPNQIMSYGNYDYFVGANDLVYITHYNGKEETVDIPGEINGKPVKELYSKSWYDDYAYEGAFYQNYDIKSVTLPESLEVISPYAFFDCAELRSVTFGSRLDYIGKWSFVGTMLESVDLPASVRIIEPESFNHSPALKEINVSEDNRYYKSVDGVLYSEDLEYLVFVPNARRGIFNIPEGTQNIDDSAMAGCDLFKEIVIPDSVKSIGVRAFQGCNRLKSFYLPDTVEKIYSAAFEHCENLKSVRLPSSLKEIPDSLFFGCHKLKNVKIPETVEKIGSFAFADCSCLETLDIPSSVEKIGFHVFGECPNLTLICEKYSAAHKYAVENDIPYMLKSQDGLFASEIGDIDTDGEITSADAVKVLRAAVGLEKLTAGQRFAADIDNDDDITSNDALMILRFSAFGVWGDVEPDDTDIPTDTDTDDTDDTDENIPPETIDLSQMKLVPDDTPDNPAQGIRSFSSDFFRNVHQKGSNTIVSPISLYTALAMLENGSSGNTREELFSLLAGGSDKFGEGDINSYMHNYIEKSNNNDVLHMANTLYVTNREDVIIDPDYAETIERDYFGEIFRATPDNATVDRINSWASKHTNGAIKKVLSEDSLNENTNSILLNATAFNGTWKRKYESDSIHNGTFTNYDNTTSEVDFMYRTLDEFYKDDLALAFRQSYEGGYSFMAILPNKGVTPEDYIRFMNGSTIDNLFSEEHYATVYTKLPKFEINGKYSLNDVLREMGMNNAFKPYDADLTRFVKTSPEYNTYVSDVRQLTHIKLDENGTKAEAVTIIGNDDVGCATDDDEEVEIYLDRPFIYVIYDDAHNIPIFMGVINSFADNA